MVFSSFLHFQSFWQLNQYFAEYVLCSQAVRLRKSSHTLFHRERNFSPLVGIGKGSWAPSQWQEPDARPQSAALSIALMVGPIFWAIQLSWSKRRKSRHHHSLQGRIVKRFRCICSILKSIKSCSANKEAEGRQMVPGVAACCSMKESVVSDPSDSAQYTPFSSEVTHTLSESLAFTLPLFSFCTLSYQLPSSKPNVENRFSATVMT